MDKLEIDVFKIENKVEQINQKPATKGTRPQIILSTLFMTIYALFLSGLFWAEISPNINPGMYQMADGEWAKQGESLIDLFQILLGVLTAGVSQILNFWFGGHAQRDNGETK